MNNQSIRSDYLNFGVDCGKGIDKELFVGREVGDNTYHVATFFQIVNIHAVFLHDQFLDVRNTYLAEHVENIAAGGQYALFRDVILGKIRNYEHKIQHKNGCNKDLQSTRKYRGNDYHYGQQGDGIKSRMSV